LTDPPQKFRDAESRLSAHLDATFSDLEGSKKLYKSLYKYKLEVAEGDLTRYYYW
jgi:hypothetical protein